MKYLRFIFFSVCLSLLSFNAFTKESAININTADAVTLAETLQGIGDNKAHAIVRYRESHGPFKSVNELVNVKGIGESIVNKNRFFIKVK